MLRDCIDDYNGKMRFIKTFICNSVGQRHLFKIKNQLKKSDEILKRRRFKQLRFAKLGKKLQMWFNLH